MATHPLRVVLPCVLIPMSLIGGCTPEEIDPGAIDPPDTESAGPPPLEDDGADETGDGGEAQRVCSVYDGDDTLVQGTTVRWHCSGTAQAWDPTSIHIVVLQVVDSTGRDDWALRLFDGDL